MTKDSSYADGGDTLEPAAATRVDENDAARLCYTSGTTGRPRGVLYSHRSIVLHAMLLLGVDSFANSERDVVMPVVPMFHVNAWGLPYAAVLAGAELMLPGPAMTPTDLIQLLVVIDEIPRTATGKFSKVALRDLAASVARSQPS
ncbi:AMP-binding protein [Plantactinospora sp. DSM 117369]